MKYCKKCGCETERYSSGDCKTCARARSAAKRAINPEINRISCANWRLKNLDREKANNAAYRAAHPERCKATRAAYYKANYEKINARTAEWRKANPEKWNAYQAVYRAANIEKCNARAAKWAKANPEKRRASASIYAKANPEVRRIQEQNRNARKRAAGGKLSKDIADKLIKLQRGKCACCGKPLRNDYQLDHIMPVALGGSNTDSNIQLLRAKCNQQKNAKHPIDFMQQRGFLL